MTKTGIKCTTAHLQCLPFESTYWLKANIHTNHTVLGKESTSFQLKTITLKTQHNFLKNITKMMDTNVLKIF